MPLLLHMKNPGQTRIFYRPGQTYLTRTKHDPVDPDNSHDPIRFQPWPMGTVLRTLNMIVYVCCNVHMRSTYLGISDNSYGWYCIATYIFQAYELLATKIFQKNTYAKVQSYFSDAYDTQDIAKVTRYIAIYLHTYARWVISIAIH